MNVEQARFNMIEQQIRPWEVLDPDVLGLLAVLRREEFVAPEHAALAFVDTAVPLPEGQSMLEPKVEARLLQELALARHEKVLEVGAGSGFMAALLAQRAQRVISLETRPTLLRMASANLRRAGVHNVELHLLDGSAGLPAEAPFDAIVLSGSVATVPQPLLDQLKVGGRLVAIVGFLPVMRALRVTRTDEREFQYVELFDTVAPRLDGFAEPRAFRF